MATTSGWYFLSWNSQVEALRPEIVEPLFSSLYPSTTPFWIQRISSHTVFKLRSSSETLNVSLLFSYSFPTIYSFIQIIKKMHLRWWCNGRLQLLGRLGRSSPMPREDLVIAASSEHWRRGERGREWQIDKQTDRQTDRRAVRQTNRKTDRRAFRRANGRLI